jgi:hypothetical protein
MRAESREPVAALQREKVSDTISGCGVTRSVAVFETPPSDAVMTTERGEATGRVVTVTEEDIA